MSTFQFFVACVLGVIVLAVLANLTAGGDKTSSRSDEDDAEDDARSRVDRSVTHDHGSIDRFGNHDES